ncbi:MAG TPA: oxidoreductase, partial [Kiloniellaceae bacterium]|nr:oxidoreductase [Kiloniellaceae bacterium]
MRVCVVGAGAIGGLMAVKLALAGNAVTVVDQGAHLAAIRDQGLKLIWEDDSALTAEVRAVASAAEAGKQDLVILAVKAHFLDQIARDIGSLLDEDTMIVTVQNGMPWWYFHGFGGELDGRRLDTLDPTGLLGRHIPGERIVGCVVYP